MISILLPAQLSQDMCESAMQNARENRSNDFGGEGRPRSCTAACRLFLDQQFKAQQSFAILFLDVNVASMGRTFDDDDGTLFRVVEFDESERRQVTRLVSVREVFGRESLEWPVLNGSEVLFVVRCLQLKINETNETNETNEIGCEI